MTVGAVALLSGFTAACSSPMTTSATGTGSATLSNQPMPPALVGNNPIANGQQTAYAAGPAGGAGTAAVQSGGALPPVTGPADYGTTPVGATMPAPTQVAATNPAGGQGASITAAPGDTLYSLSRQYGVSVAAIAAANGLTQTSTLTIGQRLVIPSVDSPLGRGDAPIGTIPAPAGTPGATAVPGTTTPTQTAAATAGNTPGQHVVQSGETIYAIATAYGISPNALMQANGMAQAELLRVGQALAIPGATRAPAPTTSAPATVVSNPTPPPVQVANNGNTAPVVTTPAPVATPTPPPTQVANIPPATPAAVGAASTNGTSFRWPLQGRMISDFGPKPGGERNDGINLSAPEGTEIRAAESGTVIYAGNEIPGYGNLVLIRHADNWVTAYAHTSAILVEKDQTVTRGQAIARVGSTGSVDAPQLHFELRRGSTPVNPMDYLVN